jgi:sugar phosphate isomerase/epimerase
LIVLSTGSLHSYGLNRVFDLAAQAGFQGIEVIVDQRWDTRQSHYLKTLQGAYGLPIVSLHSPFVPGIQGWEPPGQLNHLQRTIALAQELGARHVVTHLPFRFADTWFNIPWLREKPVLLPLPIPRHDDGYRRFLLNGLEAYAAAGITVVVENLPCRKLLGFAYNGYQMNNIAEWGRLPHLNFDTTHLGTWGYDILAVYEQVKARVEHVHLSNFNGKEHRPPWDGHLPLDELLRRLKRDAFAGILCVELDPAPLQAEDEEKVKANLRRCYEFCREHYG